MTLKTTLYFFILILYSIIDVSNDFRDICYIFIGVIFLVVSLVFLIENAKNQQMNQDLKNLQQFQIIFIFTLAIFSKSIVNFLEMCLNKHIVYNLPLFLILGFYYKGTKMFSSLILNNK